MYMRGCMGDEPWEIVTTIYIGGAFGSRMSGSRPPIYINSGYKGWFFFFKKKRQIRSEMCFAFASQ